MQVKDLRGQLLDYWVGKANGKDPHILPESENSRLVVNDGNAQYGFRHYEPSRDWAIAGPIIEAEKITIVCAGGIWLASRSEGLEHVMTSPESPLIAAMRCFVMSKFGEMVPDKKAEAVPPDGVERRANPRSRELPGNDTIH
jgi:Protein of unknown function (DUF2591)